MSTRSVGLLHVLVILGAGFPITSCDDEPAPVLTPDGGGAMGDAFVPTDGVIPDAAVADAPATCLTPAPACLGVCALQAPVCEGGVWMCKGAPGYEAAEASCDGFDNDCDGTVDEGVCAACTISSRLGDELRSMWDIDFDFSCNAYLTTNISGPDYTTVVPADANRPVTKYLGNANQNMVYALVDPNPANRRVVVTYSCCEGCGCQAKNGLTLLYECAATDAGCGCQGQANCPGFLDAPFLAAGRADLGVRANNFILTTPNGLAAGPGSAYYVGNFKPEACAQSAECDACDPAHPGIVCKPSRPNCCDASPFGRLVRFTLPTPGAEATWRVVKIIEGEQILGLASGRDGSVFVGTHAGEKAGKLYRYNPTADTLTPIATFEGAVYSVTQDRRNGDLYLEVFATPKLVRLSETGTPLDLPPSVPPTPPGEAILQVGPDHKLYRLQGLGDAGSVLQSFALP